MLLVLLLMISLMAIAALVALTPIKSQIQREREDEMLHRGTEYRRAIKKYFKKFNRYPSKLEDLDSSNNTRFLRKHFKDPVNKNQDFKLVHYGDPGVLLNAGGLGAVPGLASPQGSPLGVGPTAGTALGAQLGALAQQSAQQNFNGAAQSPLGNPPADPGSPDANSGGAYGANSGAATSGPGDSSSGSSSSLNGQLGGGPIVGVVSLSKKDAFHEFNHKHKYDQWLFVYDPSTDVGTRLLSGPNQPLIQFTSGNINGQANGNGQPNGLGAPNQNGFAPAAPAQPFGSIPQDNQTPANPPPGPNSPQ